MKAKAYIEKYRLKLLLKLLISVVCIFFLYKKINITSLLASLQNVSYSYLLMATLAFFFSKLLSVVRLQYYFRYLTFSVSIGENFKLYWIGMFYNLFLPGGIGGDAYKVYYLSRISPKETKKSIVLVIKDRLSGLVVLIILTLYLADTIGLTEQFYSSKLLVYVVVVFILLGYGLLEYFIPPASFSVLPKTIVVSFGIQFFQLLACYILILAMGVSSYSVPLLFVFLISSLVVMIPISIGGIGLRELTFLYFANYFGFETEVAVALAFLFFCLSTVVSLPGMYYHFYPPKRYDTKEGITFS